jgi:hypothetical protein
LTQDHLKAEVKTSDRLSHSYFSFPFSILRLSIIIAGAAQGGLWYMTTVIWKTKNETTKAPPSVVRPGHGAAGYLDQPTIGAGHDDLSDPEIFPAKMYLHLHSIQRGDAFDRQRAVYLSWRPRRSAL